LGKNIALDDGFTTDFIQPHELEYIQPEIETAHRLLHERRGAGKEYTGWLDGSRCEQGEISRVKELARQIREKAEVFIVVGIGGSYLGARSALELMNHTFFNQLAAEKRRGPAIYFAGHHLSAAYFSHLLDVVREKEIMLNVISKSGTTLETALAFRVLRQFMENKYGRLEARKRIIVTTDPDKGLLKDLADREGYPTLTIPGSIGGRYSVLTAVGLLPMAAGGVDVDAVLAGARAGYQLYSEQKLRENPAYRYAAVRNLLYRKGKRLELLVSYEPSFYYFIEWWKQLFGESEGKDQKGIFPAGMNFTTDLHSLGQYVQDGSRDLFATTLWVEQPQTDLVVPEEETDPDKLNYLAGRSWHDINARARAGTMLAHTSGQVPNLKISIPEITPYFYGQLVYFFLKACAISGYLLGVNPFDQPGVEAYKKNMMDLLQQ